MDNEELPIDALLPFVGAASRDNLRVTQKKRRYIPAEIDAMDVASDVVIVRVNRVLRQRRPLVSITLDILDYTAALHAFLTSTCGATIETFDISVSSEVSDARVLDFSTWTALRSFALLDHPCTVIVLPNTLERVKRISRCRNLLRLTIPKSVTYLGNLSMCESLQTLWILCPIERLNGGLCSNCTSLRQVLLPRTLRVMEEACFNACESLANIGLPKTLMSIGDSAFFGCESLSTVKIPNVTHSLGDRCFYRCSSLRTVLGGASVTHIGNFCFAQCVTLRGVPDSFISQAEENVFVGCEMLQKRRRLEDGSHETSLSRAFSLLMF